MDIKELSYEQKKDLLFEQLGLIYIVHAFIGPAMVSLKLYLEHSDIIKNTELKKEILENLGKITNKTLTCVSTKVADELVELFINKYNELFSQNFEKQIEAIAEDISTNFFKVLSAVDEDLGNQTKH